MNTEEDTSGITRTLVPESQRSEVVADLFGLHWPLRIEPYIYSMTDQMAVTYHGGYWTFYLLHCPDGTRGFYMAPDIEGPIPVICQNGWSSDLSADGLGITACLCAYSHLSFSKDERFGWLMAEHYHRLRPYMLGFDEAAILRAID
ncbi:MAG: antirestriction protein [Haliea sp.]